MKRAAPKKYYVGVDLGGTKILAAVFDDKHRLLAREKKATKPELGPAGVIGRVADCVNDVLAAAAIAHSAVVATGVGVPGLIDSPRGMVRVSPNLHWRDVPLAKALSSRLHIPVLLANDVEVGTLAVQHLGAGRGLNHFVCMFIGTGIGGGLVLNGEQYRGVDNGGGEIGHMVVVAHNGPKCGCGNRGCLEAVASRSAIVRSITKGIKQGRKSVVAELCDGDLRRIRSRIIAEAYRAGDKLVYEVINDACDNIGIGAANLINILSPQAVILGGGLIEALGDRMIARIRQAAWSHVIGATDARVRILDSGLADDAGILGAALKARNFAK